MLLKPYIDLPDNPSVNVEYSVSFKSPRIVYHLMQHPSYGLTVVHMVHHYSCGTGDL